jgi:hypothetical protein
MVERAGKRRQASRHGEAVDDVHGVDDATFSKAVKVLLNTLPQPKGVEKKEPAKRRAKSNKRKI